jgi:hypothetical protein
MSVDTPVEVEVELDRLLAQRSGAERVRMACEMFDCGRSIAVGAIRMQQPGIGEAGLRVALFDRMYGGDDDDEDRAWIRTRLVASRPPDAG